MPSYIDASDEHVKEVKKSITDKGGKITHEHKLVKAVTAEFPEDHVGGLDAHPSVEEVEKDQTVTTQQAGVVTGA